MKDHAMFTYARLPMGLLLLGALSTTALTAGCTDRPYASPQEAAQNACRALGPKALSGLWSGGSAVQHLALVSALQLAVAKELQ